MSSSRSGEIATEQAGHFFVSMAQGAPEESVALVASFVGLTFRSFGRWLQEARDEEGRVMPTARAIGDEFIIAGTAAYAVAAVDAAGSLFQNIAEAARGRTKPPVTYDVTGGKGSSSVSISNPGGGGFGSGLPLPLPIPLPAGGALVAGGGALVELVGTALIAGIPAYLVDQVAPAALNATVGRMFEIWGQGGSEAQQVSQGAAVLSQTGIFKPEAVINLATALLPQLRALRGGLNFIPNSGSGVPLGEVDGQSYFSQETYHAALTAKQNRDRELEYLSKLRTAAVGTILLGPTGRAVQVTRPGVAEELLP